MKDELKKALQTLYAAWRGGSEPCGEILRFLHTEEGGDSFLDLKKLDPDLRTAIVRVFDAFALSEFSAAGICPALTHDEFASLMPGYQVDTHDCIQGDI